MKEQIVMTEPRGTTQIQPNLTKILNHNFGIISVPKLSELLGRKGEKKKVQSNGFVLILHLSIAEPELKIGMYALPI